MILENLDVCIKTDSTRLTEYARVRSDKDTVECWIPSEQGKNFTIHWDFLRRPKRARLGLHCGIWLDGIRLQSGKHLRPSDISNGVLGSWSSTSSGNGRRKFLFGKLQIIDQEDLLLEDPGCQVQTIKVKLSWTQGHKKQYFEEVSPPISSSKAQPLNSGIASNSEANLGSVPTSASVGETDARWIHEQLARKGHDGSAQLGPLILPNPIPPATTSQSTPATPSTITKHGRLSGGKPKKIKNKKSFRWTYEIADKAPLFFVFHHAPLEWLQNRGIARRPGPIPLVDLTIDQPQILRGLAQDNTSLHLITPTSIPQHEHEREVGAATANLALPTPGDCIQCGPGVLSTQAELLKSFNPAIDYSAIPSISRQEETTAMFGQVTTSSIHALEHSQPNIPSVVPGKRQRETDITDVIDIDTSDDDEIVLLDVKPSKLTTKRPRIKYEDEDVKPVFEQLEVKPNITNHQEIDCWRLGC